MWVHVIRYNTPTVLYDCCLTDVLACSYAHSALGQSNWAALSSGNHQRTGLLDVLECWMYRMDRLLAKRTGRTIITRSPRPQSPRITSDDLSGEHQIANRRCQTRAIDDCDDPLCNRSCPTIVDPKFPSQSFSVFDSLLRSDRAAVLQVWQKTKPHWLVVVGKQNYSKASDLVLSIFDGSATSLQRGVVLHMGNILCKYVIQKAFWHVMTMTIRISHVRYSTYVYRLQTCSTLIRQNWRRTIAVLLSKCWYDAVVAFMAADRL